ncbi:unnamed protein product, partial [Nesidiocoris tenuis]
MSSDGENVGTSSASSSTNVGIARIKEEIMETNTSPPSSSVIIAPFSISNVLKSSAAEQNKSTTSPGSPDDDDDDEDDDDLAEGPTERGTNGFGQSEEQSFPWVYEDDGPDDSESKKRKIIHTFEKDPIARKRQCNRLYKRVKLILDELNARVGQQVVVIMAQPPTSKVNTIKTYGSTPLRNVVTRYHPTIIRDLSEALASKEPSRIDNPLLFDLPNLIIDGVATPIHKMTQAQLREFIPLMLRYSTGRGKPGWGHESTRPCWWPMDIPWANVRVDLREPDVKNRETWSAALRRIIVACYEHHGRLDLLNAAGGWQSDGNPDRNGGDSPEHEQFSKLVNGEIFTQKNGDKRRVILTDAEGQEYCVEIAVSDNPIGGHSLFGNLPFVENDGNLALDDGRVGNRLTFSVPLEGGRARPGLLQLSGEKPTPGFVPASSRSSAVPDRRGSVRKSKSNSS